MKSIHPSYPSTVLSLLFIDMSLDPRKTRKGLTGYKGTEQSAFRGMAEEATGGFRVKCVHVPSLRIKASPEYAHGALNGILGNGYGTAEWV